MFGRNAPAALKTAIRRYLDPNIEQGGNLSNIMYYAAYLGTTLDYFLAVDYTAYADIKLFGTSDTKAIKNKKIKKFVSRLLLLPKSRKSKIFRCVLDTYWAEKVPDLDLSLKEADKPVSEELEATEPTSEEQRSEHAKAKIIPFKQAVQLLK